MEQDERRLKVYRDWKSTVETAEFKGHERGLEEGLAKGEEIGLAKIIQYTHLTEEEINKL